MSDPFIVAGVVALLKACKVSKRRAILTMCEIHPNTSNRRLMQTWGHDQVLRMYARTLVQSWEGEQQERERRS